MATDEERDKEHDDAKLEELIDDRSWGEAFLCGRRDLIRVLKWHNDRITYRIAAADAKNEVKKIMTADGSAKGEALFLAVEALDAIADGRVVGQR
jgi:hypothetical protein